MTDLTPHSRDAAAATMRRLTVGGAVAGLTLTGAVAGVMARAELTAAAAPTATQPPATPPGGPATLSLPHRIVVVVDEPAAGPSGGIARSAGAAAVPPAPAAAPPPRIAAPQQPVAPAGSTRQHERFGRAMTYVTAAREAALGTYAELAVTDAAALPAARALLHAELVALDLACSRFREDSELSAVNAGAGAPVAAGPLLREALRVALAAAGATGGLVDPTLGAELMAAGYDRDFASLPADAQAREPLQAGVRRERWPEVIVDDDAGAVTVPVGCRLDLGATGKAHGADRAAARIASQLGVGALVSLGGDVAMAGAPPRSGWPVRVGARVGARRRP